MPKIYGIDLDRDGRCTHYHSKLDVVALRCSDCQQYYACYRCHDELMDHSFLASDPAQGQPVMCGNCHHLLTFEQYQLGECIFCQHQFSPRCKSHHQVYFLD